MEDDKAAAEAESHEIFSNQLQVERQAAADAVEGMKTELDAALAAEVRAERDRLLVAVDVVVSNPLRWADLSSDKQTEWTVYRQALLDVPQQSGFPSTVVWPPVVT